MSRVIYLSRLAIVITVAGFMAPCRVSAQSIWLDRSHSSIVALEILKPDFQDNLNTTFATSLWFLSLRYALSENIALALELPFANGGIEFRDGSESQGTIGNPYLGIEAGKEGFPVFGEIGIRAPLTNAHDNFGTQVGFFSELVDRAEAFAPDYLPVTGMVNFRYHAASGFTIRLRSGPVLWINTDKQEFEDGTEVFILYSGQIGYESQQVGISGGFSGRHILSEDYIIDENPYAYQLGFAASFGTGNVRPGAEFRLPLNKEWSDILDFVFGLNLAINLK